MVRQSIWHTSSVDPKHVSYLEVAEVYHAIHHLTDTEAVAEVVKRVVAVVLLNSQLEPKEKQIPSQRLNDKKASSQSCPELPAY